jgi:3D (Asp-Asp-Asp) domain-containing protein
VANRYLVTCLAWARRNLKTYCLGRGFPLTIAILWIGSLAVYTVMQADAEPEKVSGRIILTHRQPVSASLAAMNSDRVGGQVGRLLATGSRSLSTTSSSTGIQRERLLIAVVQSPPRAIRTKPTLADTPPKPTQQHEHGATHPVKASLGAKPTVAAGPSHTLQVWVTGYDLYGITSTGVPAGSGICAVDPYTIPLGTHITIAGVGSCVAADTGPAVVGAHIDVWVPDYQSAVNLTGYYTASW